jgi:hypothetical protein
MPVMFCTLHGFLIKLFFTKRNFFFGQGGDIGLTLLWSKTKREKLRCLLLRRIFFALTLRPPIHPSHRVSSDIQRFFLFFASQSHHKYIKKYFSFSAISSFYCI